MAEAQLEVTVDGFLSAAEGDAERLPTDQEFFGALDGMADKLHDTCGLVDPLLWGQASNGRIEFRFCFPGCGDAEAATARAMVAVVEASEAAGVRFENCQGEIDAPRRAPGRKIELEPAVSGADRCSGLVLKGTCRIVWTAATVSV